LKEYEIKHSYGFKECARLNRAENEYTSVRKKLNIYSVNLKKDDYRKKMVYLKRASIKSDSQDLTFSKP
jgi:hypothetical protein